MLLRGVRRRRFFIDRLHRYFVVRSFVVRSFVVRSLSVRSFFVRSFFVMGLFEQGLFPLWDLFVQGFFRQGLFVRQVLRSGGWIIQGFKSQIFGRQIVVGLCGVGGGFFAEERFGSRQIVRQFLRTILHRPGLGRRGRWRGLSGAVCTGAISSGAAFFGAISACGGSTGAAFICAVFSSVVVCAASFSGAVFSARFFSGAISARAGFCHARWFHRAQGLSALARRSLFRRRWLCCRGFRCACWRQIIFFVGSVPEIVVGEILVGIAGKIGRALGGRSIGFGSAAKNRMAEGIDIGFEVGEDIGLADGAEAFKRGGDAAERVSRTGGGRRKPSLLPNGVVAKGPCPILRGRGGVFGFAGGVGGVDTEGAGALACRATGGGGVGFARATGAVAGGAAAGAKVRAFRRSGETVRPSGGVTEAQLAPADGMAKLALTWSSDRWQCARSATAAA